MSKKNTCAHCGAPVGPNNEPCSCGLRGAQPAVKSGCAHCGAPAGPNSEPCSCGLRGAVKLPGAVMPVIRNCDKCGRTLANSGVVCPCQGGVDDTVVQPPVTNPDKTPKPPGAVMPVIRKCKKCGRTLANSGVKCPCKGTKV